ncbi:MAG: hypothetical protein U1F67_06935 [Rubrivivax sp.]
MTMPPAPIAIAMLGAPLPASAGNAASTASRASSGCLNGAAASA